MYPHIALMAQDLVGVMATSVPSESIISKAGLGITNKRTRLNDDSVAASLELQSFLDYNGKEVSFKSKK